MRRDDLGGQGEKLATVDALASAIASSASCIRRLASMVAIASSKYAHVLLTGTRRQGCSLPTSCGRFAVTVGRDLSASDRPESLSAGAAMRPCTSLLDWPAASVRRAFCFPGTAPPQTDPSHPKARPSGGPFLVHGGSDDLLHPLARRAGGRLALAELLARRDRLPRHRQAARQRGGARQAAGAARPRSASR